MHSSNAQSTAVRIEKAKDAGVCNCRCFVAKYSEQAAPNVKQTFFYSTVVPCRRPESAQSKVDDADSEDKFRALFAPPSPARCNTRRRGAIFALSVGQFCRRRVDSVISASYLMTRPAVWLLLY